MVGGVYVIGLLVSLSVCLSVYPFVPNVVNAISWQVFQHWWIFGTGGMLQVLGAKRQRPTSREVRHAENVLSGLFSAMSCKPLDYFLPNVLSWPILGQGWTLQRLRSKGQRSRTQDHSMTKAEAYSMYMQCNAMHMSMMEAGLFPAHSRKIR